MRVYGLIPAAGSSRRMGRPKLALPLGERSVLEHVVAAGQHGGLDAVLVVLGPPSQFLQAPAEAAGARVLALDAETPDMQATTLAGLEHLARIGAATDDDCWLLLPADHPTLDAAVIRELIALARADASHSIFVPVHAGTRGHPTLLRWRHAVALHSAPPGQGINRYIRAHAAETREVDWPADDILYDLDTPADYEAAQRRFGRIRTS